MIQLTPRQIVAELDKYIIGQGDAKRAVAVAVRNRWRRQQLPDGIRQDVSPKNILMIGPTGVGKTEIARRLAGLTGAPFVKVEATKYTEVGYHGRDVESMVRDLLDVGIALVRQEMHQGVREGAEQQVDDRLLDMLLPAPTFSSGPDDEAETRRAASREKMRQQLKAGALEEQLVEISTEERPNIDNLLGAAGLGSDADLSSMFERMMPTRRESKRLTVSAARQVLFGQEAEKLSDKDKLLRTAIERVEQSGIIFLDEIDKIAGTGKSDGPDVSRQGVQRDLLPIVEGSAISTKHGVVKTDHILFIAAGAFHTNTVSDLMPELQGRFPIRVELQDLTKDDFVRILTEPQSSLTTQQKLLLETEGVEIDFAPDGTDAIAQIAYEVNRKTQNIGARRLYTIMERVFEMVSFEAPDMTDKKVTITGKYVKDRLKGAGRSEDYGGYLL